jgi:hypothetical protein
MSDDDLIRRGDVLRIALAYATGEGAAYAELAIRALPAVQPDAAAIRDKVLREVLGNLGGVELFGSTPQDTHAALEQWCRCRDMIYALIDTGKEVMPDERPVRVRQTDIGPGDQAVAGAAQCCMCGKKGLSTEEDGGPECELADGRWVCSSDCYDVALGIMLKPVAGAAQPDKINWRDDPDAIVEDDEPQIGRDYA